MQNILGNPSCAAPNGVTPARDLEGPPQRIVTALELLADSYRYAQHSRQGIWNFAIEIQDLKTAGLSTSDLQWLKAMGYVETAVEVTTVWASTREFQHDNHVIESPNTCFVPTPKGIELVLLDSNAMATSDVQSHPKYDSDRRELRVYERLVKRFKRPSRNQVCVLTAFQEEGWPIRIDDPIPPAEELDSKLRLRDTIKALNRNQTNKLLRFSGDGTGEGVRWTIGTVS